MRGTIHGDGGQPLTKVSEKLTAGSTLGCEQIPVIALTNAADDTPPGWSSARRTIRGPLLGSCKILAAVRPPRRVDE
jgi:hypothetical protein